MTYIYLDVLLITNIYVNYFLLKGTARITHTALSFKRCIFASVLGTVTALTILLPEQTFLINLFLKILGALFIVKLAFSKLTIKRFIKLTAIFFGMSFVFAGVMLIVCEVIKIPVIIVNNYSVYFNISILALAISTIIAYIAVCIIANILDKKLNVNHSYKVNIQLFDKKYILNGICDTGNSLIDTFSGKPVIICNSKEIASLADIDFNSEYNSEQYIELFRKFKGLRLLPYSTIGNQGIIPAFLADSITITDERNQIKPVDAYIGLSLNGKIEYQAIFNPRLLI